jgi:hypothetical protein
MGALYNPTHERFAQEMHRRTLAREPRPAALVAAYREHILRDAATSDEKIYNNARRLANSPQVRARIRELGDLAAKLAGIDAGWAMLKLKELVDANLDDYMRRTDGGDRVLDLNSPSREQIGWLSELQQEEATEDDGATHVRKVKIKLHPKIDAIRLMADIGGWKSPAKIAPTNVVGDGPATLRHEFSEIDAARRAIAVIAEEAQRMAAEAGDG